MNTNKVKAGMLVMYDGDGRKYKVADVHDRQPLAWLELPDGGTMCVPIRLLHYCK